MDDQLTTKEEFEMFVATLHGLSFFYSLIFFLICKGSRISMVAAIVSISIFALTVIYYLIDNLISWLHYGRYKKEPKVFEE